MGRYDQYSDEELIVRLREGETEISDYLMEKYKEFVRDVYKRQIVHRHSAMHGSIWMIMDWKRLMFR